MNDSPPLDAVGDGAGNGRGANGRFGAGNTFAKGNPFARQVQAIRAAPFDAVTPEAIREAVLAVLAQAKAGDRQALAEILDRTLGKAVPADLEERLAALEEALEARDAR